MKLGLFTKSIFYILVLLFIGHASSQNIKIVKPTDGEIVFALQEYRIKYQGPGEDSVFIEYSDNYGITWKEIKHRFWFSYSSEVLWQVPLAFSKSILLRITNKFNPNDFYQLKKPLVVADGGVDFINVNAINMFFSNTGIGSSNPLADNFSSFSWRNNTVLTVTMDGLVWAGKVNNFVNANGIYWQSGLSAGIPLQFSDNPEIRFKSNHIWKIRKNWQDISDNDYRNRLKHDFENWPVEAGAPWDDVNKDGYYTSGIDLPKFIGNETNWFVMNDMDREISKSLFDSEPIGLEIQCTIFAYNQPDFLKDVVFKKYLIINKGNNTIEDMYFSYWADYDLADPVTDYAGCDTSLNLGFGYNSSATDYNYHGQPPPAIGYQLLQGVTNENIKKSFSSFSATLKYWYEGITYPYRRQQSGAYHVYNNLRCLTTYNGDDIINPITNKSTKFMLAGDPVQQEGWYDGPGWPGLGYKSDRTIYINSGPIRFEPGDTQKVVVAIIMAQGNDRLDSIAKLKEKAAMTMGFFKSEIEAELHDVRFIEPPDGFLLKQNYPNPFNPTTTIPYTVGANNHSPLRVSLKIYDVLGREVKTLVNKKQPVGKYRVTFDASGLASGVYYYRIAIHSDKIDAGEFMQTKKMLLLR